MSQYVHDVSPPAVTEDGGNTARRSRLSLWPEAVQYWSIQMNRLIEGAYRMTWSQQTPPAGLSAYSEPTLNVWKVWPPSTEKEITSLFVTTTLFSNAATLGSFGSR